MLAFIIPTKSAQLSSDWSYFSKLVERTLKSVTNQKNQDYQVVVVCHELPETDFTHPKLSFIQVDFPPPTLSNTDIEKDRQLKEADKAKKIQAGIAFAEKFSPDYCMVVDSDDCISNKISGFVAKNTKDKIGWYFKKGYFYREGEKIAYLNLGNFNSLCGSCIIVRWDLAPKMIVKEPFLYYFHERTEISPTQPLEVLPFYGSMYSMANGENHHMSPNLISSLVHKYNKFSLQYIKSLWSKAKKYRPRYIGPLFKKSFGFYQISKQS